MNRLSFKEILFSLKILSIHPTQITIEKNHEQLTELTQVITQGFHYLLLLNFQKLLSESYTLQQQVLQLLLKTAKQKQIYLHRMIGMSSRQRILHFLLDYVADIGQRVGYEWVIRTPFSMTQIGQLSHTSRQTASTLMNELKRAYIIHFNRKYLIIRDLDLLKKRANSKYEND